MTTTHTEIDLEAKYKLTLTILVHNHPGKSASLLKKLLKNSEWERSSSGAG